MASLPTIAEQIQAIAASALRLRELVGNPLPALNTDLYLRPVHGGCTAISVDPLWRPQQGIMRRWAATNSLQAWRVARDLALAGRDGTPGRVTPEKALQALLIRDAIRNHGWMDLLAAACPEQPRLRFLTDELALHNDDGRTICDLVAVRFLDGLGTPVVIEVKSARHLKRMATQACCGAAMIEADLAAFQQLAESSWGEPIRLSTTAERWIIWPSAGADRDGDHDPKAGKCRRDGLRLVTYAGTPGGELVLRATSV